MKQELLLNGDSLSFSVDHKGDESQLQFQDAEILLKAIESAPGKLRISGPNGSHRACVARDKDRILVWLDGRHFEFTQPSTDSDTPEGESFSKNELHAPMPGTVIKLSVSVGDSVAEGQTLVVVEAMKMEHNLRAPISGKVAQIKAKVGEIVGTESALVVLADED